MRISKSIFAIAAVALASLAIPASAEAAEGVARQSGTLRAGPGADYPSIDSISRGEELHIYGCTRGYSWCDVENGDSRGWFQGSRIAFQRNGRTVYLPDVAREYDIPITPFVFGTYWGNHYRDRAFYDQPRYWRGNGPRPDMRDNRPPPGQDQPRNFRQPPGAPPQQFQQRREPDRVRPNQPNVQQQRPQVQQQRPQVQQPRPNNQPQQPVRVAPRQDPSSAPSKCDVACGGR